MEAKKRVEWLDVARGLGLLFVIIGHTMTTPIRNASETADWIYTGMYFFHMPFMFYLSGRTFGMFGDKYRKRSNKEWVKKKWNTLMVPYLVYGILVYLIFAIANSMPSLNHILDNAGYGKQSIFQWVKGAVIGYNQYSYHLWFIYALFLMNMISFFIIKYVKKHKLVLFVITILCMALRIWVNTSSWGIVNLAMKCYFWFVLGTYVDLSKYIKKGWGLVLQGVSVVYMVIYAVNIGNWTWFVSESVKEPIKWCMDLGIILLCIHIAVLLTGKAKQIFLWTGEHSYGIYLFHQPFFASGSGLVLYKVLGLPLWIAILITFVLCYGGSILIMRLLDIKYFRWLTPLLLGKQGIF